MGLRIFLTGDLHIGMKFNNYPENIRNLLIDARLNVLQEMVETANDKNCNIFAVAGDMFDNIKISNKDIDRVIKMLSDFSGECVVAMPGNHDYDNGMVDLWKRFKGNLSEKVILANENKPYSLIDYGINAIVYPAYCNSKHSEKNNLAWIKDLHEYKEGVYHIGMAHGSLSGLSPDMEGSYFPMTGEELLSIPMDVWLLGHTHISYPAAESTLSNKIFNAGTPEPDGFDCKHGGSAWLIDLDLKTVKGNRVETGKYRFYDVTRETSDVESFNNIKKEFINENHENNLLRLNLKGRIRENIYNTRQEFYKEMEKNLAYFTADDNDLSIKLSKDEIKKEFTKGSLPYKLLNEISEDEEALFLAYEIIKEVREC